VAFSDVGCYNIWKDKAFGWGLDIIESDYLERKTNDDDNIKGFDLADFLTRILRYWENKTKKLTCMRSCQAYVYNVDVNPYSDSG
jgi:hypothetical protein